MKIQLGFSGVAALVLLGGVGYAAELTNQTRPMTFSKDVAPIFQAKCESCHRPGSMAPMPLISYEQARPWAKAIKQRVVARQMPPWHVDKTVGIQKFANDFSLSDNEISVIARWADGGAPQGDAKDMPAPRVWKEDNGWQLAKQFGEPDMVLKSADYTMPAKAQDAWFRPLTEIPITEPRWVRAVEIRPSTPNGRRTFHHVLANLQQDEPGVSFVNGAGNAGLLMEWAMNKNYDIYRPNTGKLLLPGAHISWEMHLHAVGEEIRDHAELAVYLYPKGEEPKFRTFLTAFQATDSTSSSRLDIAPNTISQTQGYTVLRAPARLENFQPHMHLRGKAMSIEAILPTGQRQILGHVDHFNFNWMTNYIFADDAAPVLPKGTIVHITAWHDNTVNNPNNPDPNQWVGWGDRTVDEMAHMWVNVTYIGEDDYQKWAAEHQPKTVAAIE